jgi:hypothetical protein
MEKNNLFKMIKKIKKKLNKNYRKRNSNIKKNLKLLNLLKIFIYLNKKNFILY